MVISKVNEVVIRDTWNCPNAMTKLSLEDGSIASSSNESRRVGLNTMDERECEESISEKDIERGVFFNKFTF